MHQPAPATTTTALEAMNPSAVLFDLDGTITDSGPVIIASIAEALEHFGLPERTEEELLTLVGPPIRVGFRTILGIPEDEVDAVVAEYRARYNERMLQAPLFPGVADIIRDLHARGVPLAVATSKRQSLAVVIIQDAGLTPYFVAVRGASDDETRSSKVHIMEDALNELRAVDADLERAVMVGDRSYDVNGAREHGLPAILVSWGYAEADEGLDAHAVAHTSEELATLLG